MGSGCVGWGVCMCDPDLSSLVKMDWFSPLPPPPFSYFVLLPVLMDSSLITVQKLQGRWLILESGEQCIRTQMPHLGEIDLGRE